MTNNPIILLVIFKCTHCLLVFPWFLMRSQLLILLRLPCVMSCFCLAAFNILSFEGLIMICLGMELFEFNLLGVHWASWIGRYFPSMWDIFNHSFFQYSAPFSFFYVYIGTFGGILKVLEVLLIVLHSCFFLFLREVNFNRSIFKFADSFSVKSTAKPLQ